MSRIPVNDDAKRLADILSKSSSKAELRQNLSDLLTPTEIKTILERWDTFGLLLGGATHREVQQQIGISISKVTHAANLLKNQGAPGVRRLWSTAKK